MGPAGVEGKMGGKGRPGNAGPPGHKGATGVAGKRGMPGKVGHPGERGPAGAPGADGKPGNRGPAGKVGRAGMKGMAGVRGKMGAAGARGAVGKAGPQGEPGRDGQDSNLEGPQGAPGRNGPPGEAGEDAVFQWAEIDVMVANSLFSKLSHGSEYCGKANEMCKCGLVEEPTDPVPVPVVQKPVLDMVVLVDGSESLSGDDWGALRSWLVDFIHSFNTPEIKAKYDRTSAMVVVQFSTHTPGASTNFGGEDGYLIKRGKFNELDQLEDELKGMFQMAQGSDTFMALEYLIHDVVPSMDNDWRNYGDDVRHNRVLTMVVNGEPNDADFNSEYNSKWQHRTLDNNDLLAALDMTFTDRYVIGVGSGISEYNSAYSKINKNSKNVPMMKIDKYFSNDSGDSTLNQEFLATVVKELTTSVLNYEPVTYEFHKSVMNIADPY